MSPRFVSGSQKLGRAGSAGAGSPSHSLAAPGERHGACSLAQSELCLKQPFSMDFGDNLCFQPQCAGWGWGRAGPGAEGCGGSQSARSRRALATCGGSGGTGLRPQLGRDTRCQAAGSAHSRSVCHPGVCAGNPAHELQFLTGSRAGQVLGTGDLGMRSLLGLLGLCSRLCCLQLASRSRQRHRYNSLFLSILEGTLIYL